MGSLQLSQFIKANLLEESRIPSIRIMPGTMVDYQGTKWKAKDHDPGNLGWTWERIGGIPNKYNPDSKEAFFKYDHPIYNMERFNHEVQVGRPVLRDKRKVQNIGVLPPEVTDAESAYKYAKTHPGWTVGEHYIKKDAKFSYLYARDVLQGVFPAGEPAMKLNPDYWQRYVKMIERLAGK